MQVSTVVAVAIGGACGALCRFGANATIERAFDKDHLPIATFCVNMVGCFLLGLLVGLSSHSLPAPVQVGLATGFLGSLTTFSTYAVEIATRSENRYWWTAAAIGLANLVVGVALAFAGLALARSLAK